MPPADTTRGRASGVWRRPRVRAKFEVFEILGKAGVPVGRGVDDHEPRQDLVGGRFDYWWG